MSKKKVLLLENIHDKAVEQFENNGFSVERISGALAPGELKEKIADVNVLGIRSKTKITEDVIEAAPNLHAIGAFCIGTNQIDIPKCSEKGIAIFNAPYSNTRSVVELALGQIIMLSRRIFEKSEKLHNGEWDKSAEGSVEKKKKKLGIIGYGNIGSQLSFIAEVMGMDVYYFDIEEKLAVGKAKKCSSMDEIFSTCDFVTVHVDGRPENKNIIGENEFSLMKEGSIFLNLSRGFVVDLQALTKYLDSGKIKGAAIDVFPKEPKSNGENFDSVLRNQNNVILTPHIGGSTLEAQENIADFVPEKIIKYLEHGSTIMSVNFPNLRLPELKDAHRIIHIHQNMPGVLADINSLFASQGINIRAQYLKTSNGIGYVISDVNKPFDEKTKAQLERMDATIRLRVLPE